MAYFLGLDAGGSKTEWALADETGTVVARASGGGANLQRVTASDLRSILQEGLSRLGGPWPEVVCAGFAGAGDAKARAMAREVLEELLRPQRLYVVGDMEVALEAAVGAGPGVVLIAGTGSIAYGRNAHGQQARAGGRGPDSEAGDPGSGFDIGWRATERESIAGKTPEELAALVPKVVVAARAGDAAARKILQDAGRALGRLAVEVLNELGIRDTDVLVAATGGVFAASEEVFERVREELGRAAPRARLERLQVSPAEGAVRLGRRLWQQEQVKG